MGNGVGPEVAERIDGVFEEWDSEVSPGCALGIYLDGEIAYSRGYGLANLEHGIPIGPDSVFHVASISKQFAAHCVVLLAKAGRLSLDDDVREYLPELPDYGHEITIRHLIHHTSGLRDQWELLRLAGWREDDLITDEDVLDIVPRQTTLNFPPGEQEFYSNSGYTFLGLIVQRVSGRGLRRFADELIFEPLGMTRTHFHDDHNEIVPGRTHGYVPGKQGVGFRISNPIFDTVGATSLHTTVNDLFRWDQYLERWLPKPENQGHLERGVLNDGRRLAYGCGLRYATHHGVETVGHSGADAGYRAHYLRVPSHRLGIAALCNLSTMMPANLVDDVLAILLHDHLALPIDERPTPIDLSDEQLARFIGVYRGKRTSAVQEVGLENGRLVLPLSGNAALDPIAEDRFVSDDMPFAEVRFSNEDEDTGLRMVLGEMDEFTQVPGVDPAGIDLSKYVGLYQSRELVVDYRLTLDDGELKWRQRRYDPRSLRLLLEDTAVHGRFWFEFQRDGDGTVRGFTVSSVRARGMLFERVEEERQS
jgi:CubicO group peptidase (beta-lactamase class C family)